MSETPTTAPELEAAIAREYGSFVATQPIDINGARAFNTGDPVPASHVANGVVRDDQVAKTTTKAGREAAASNDTSKG